MSTSLPRIEIIMAGNTLPAIREEFGEFYQWYQDRPALPADYRIYTVFEGQPLPDPKESDGWIITGASDSVNDPLAWLPDVRKGIKAAVELDHAILGVCFGHQLLASTLGGRVTLNDKGWEIGQVRVSLTEAGTQADLFEDFANPINVYATHKEIVESPPADATILAQNEKGIQSIQIGTKAFGVQFHPEFDVNIAKRYVDLRGLGGDVGSGDEYGAADESSKVLTNFIKIVSC